MSLNLKFQNRQMGIQISRMTLSILKLYGLDAKHYVMLHYLGNSYFHIKTFKPWT